MRLEGPKGQSLELQLLGYQFPEEKGDSCDANWLIVQGHDEHPRGSWKFRDSCLLTSDIPQLADWLEAVGGGIQHESELEFLEPNLRFCVPDPADPPFVRVYFELECRPDWAASRIADEEDLWIDIPVSKSAFFSAASFLREQLREFPPR